MVCLVSEKKKERFCFGWIKRDKPLRRLGMYLSEIRIELFCSFNGVFYNDIQTCIISKEPDTSINVFDNVVNIYQKRARALKLSLGGHQRKFESNQMQLLVKQPFAFYY